MKKVLVFTTIYFILTSNLFSDDKKISILYKINNNIITNFDVQKEANYLKILNKNLETIKKVQILQLAEKSLIRETVKKNEIEIIDAEATMRADVLVNLDAEGSEKLLKIMNFLDDLDDVQEVHTNRELNDDFEIEE